MLRGEGGVLAHGENLTSYHNALYQYTNIEVSYIASTLEDNLSTKGHHQYIKLSHSTSTFLTSERGQTLYRGQNCWSPIVSYYWEVMTKLRQHAVWSQGQYKLETALWSASCQVM